MTMEYPQPQDDKSKDRFPCKALYFLCSEESWSEVLRHCKRRPIDARYRVVETPLSVACRLNAPAEVIKALVEAYPQAVAVESQIECYNDGFKLPVHIICRKRAPLSVLQALLKGHCQFEPHETTTATAPADGALVQAVQLLWKGRDTTVATESFSGEVWQKIEAVLIAIATIRDRSCQVNFRQDSPPCNFIPHAAVALAMSLSPTGFGSSLPDQLLKFVLHRYPEQIHQRDHAGQLPLHISLALLPPSSSKSMGFARTHRHQLPTTASRRQAQHTGVSVQAILDLQQPFVFPATARWHQHRQLADAVMDLIEANDVQLRSTMMDTEHSLNFDAASEKSNLHKFVHKVFEVAPHACVVLDPLSGLYPFQMAATVGEANEQSVKSNLKATTSTLTESSSSSRQALCLSTIFSLVRAQPNVLKLACRELLHDSYPFLKTGATAA